MGSRGRQHPQNQQPGFAPGYNQYPQNRQQGPHRGQHSIYGNKQRRDRARPHSAYSYYSEESFNSLSSRSGYSQAPGSSLSQVSGMGRGAGGGINQVSGVGRGEGSLINHSDNSPLYVQPPMNERRVNDRYRGGYGQGGGGNYVLRKINGPLDQTNQTTNRRGQDRENNKADNRTRRDHPEDMTLPTMYFCPKCGQNYNSRHSQNKFAGKTPLILHCSHTMCQECIYHEFKNNKVNCPICKNDSVLTQEQTPVCQSDMQNVFLPNFYILGVMFFYKSSGNNLRNIDNMTFVSTGSKKNHRPFTDNSERCCFGSCSKEATIFCPNCEGIFCSDCSTVVHKSTKVLMTHEPVPLRRQRFSLMLENCVEHPQMQVEFFCKTCDLSSCCYCVLDKHTDHERVALYHLNENEMEEFKRLKKVAEKVLKEVLSTQKKTSKLANFDTGSVKKDVCQYFADIHAKLESVEKKLCDELETFKTTNKGLENTQTSLMASAEQLKTLVAFNEDKIGDRKLNLRGALQKLRNVEDIPRFLLNERGQSEPVRFVINNTVRENLENEFTLEKCENSEYKLVTAKDLPEDYNLTIDESDTEVEEEISAIQRSSQNVDLESVPSQHDLPVMMPSASSSQVSKKIGYTKQKENFKKKIDMQRVEVQHINSMDSFFVHHKNEQAKLSQLNKDIENYVKMGGAESVKDPQLNDLYLALYVNESRNQKEQKWCRARITEIKNTENGPMYELFFIDYGKTQLADAKRIKDIPAHLAQKKPFAVECMLYNPMSVNWNKKAHYSLARILNGKDVYIMEKSNNQGVLEVDLMIASSDGGVTSVTDILVHALNSVEPIDDVSSVDGSVSAKKDGYFPSLRVFPNSRKFTKNQKERVTIANVVDPHSIFIHLVQHQDSFKAMNHAIKKAYKHSKSAVCVPIEGTYVLVEYKDPIRTNWHRAFVKNVDLHSDKVQVLLVDWGLNVVVPAQNIRPLQETFTKLESQAVVVKLAHIEPYNKQAVWSQQAINFLHAYHKSQDALKMVVHETEPEVLVALFDVSGNVDMCLNAMMVENNLADSTGPVSTKVQWPRYDISNPEFSEDDGLMSSLLKKANEEAEADDSEEEDLTDVKRRQVDVVKVDAPDCIWVKFLEFKEREAAMFKELQIHYSQEQSAKREWTQGEQCVTELGSEYVRGKIVEKVGELYKIYLIDKVKEITVSIDKIYKYDKYFAKYPQAAIKCHLANIRPAGGTGKWSISSTEALQEVFTKHSRIYANKASEANNDLSSHSLPLDMWYGLIIRGGPLDPDRMKYVSINNLLTKLGFAFKVPRPTTKTTHTPVKTAATGEELLKSLLKIGDYSESNESQSVSKEESTVEKDDSKPEAETETSNADKTNINAILERSREKVKNEKTVEVDVHVSGEGKKVAKREKKEPSKTVEVQDVKKIEEQVLKKIQKSTKEDKKSKKDNKKSDKNKEDNKPNKESKDDAKTEKKDDEITSWNELVEQELANESVSDSQDESNSSPYHKSEIAIDDWPPAFRLSKKEFKARVTCVETGGHLYLHEETMDDLYYKMEVNIKEYFDGNHPKVTDHQWEPGQLCTIKYNDGNWYRGKILKVKGPDVISVFMIDFGSDHDLSPDVLFREVLYTDVGCFATKVKLDKIYARSGSWLTSDYDNFHDLISDWCKIVVQGPIDVEVPLVDVYNENNVYVNQRLVELCPNLSRCSNFPVQEAAQDEDDNVIIESIEESGADEVINIIMENFDRALNLKEFGQEGKKDIPKYTVADLPVEFLQGKKMIMQVGGILSFNKIALSLPGSDVSTDMYDLTIEIQDVVDTLPNLTEFVLGMPCIAQFSEDGIWYRARITGTKTVDLGFVDVIFVDYGNSESVTTDSVKVIREEYLKLPQQSWEASVNIALLVDDLIPVMQLMNSLDKKMKYVKIVKENPLTVDLYEKNDKLCYETLLRSGTLKPLYD